MGTDAWNGGIGNWSVAANWANGVPISTSAVTVASGEAEVTSFIRIASLFNAAILDFANSGSSTIYSGFTNAGALNFDAISATGGSNLKIGGTLLNTGIAQFGAADNSLAASDIVTVNSFNNYIGELDIYGGKTAAQEMTLSAAGAASFGASGIVLGDVSISGHAEIEFASGQITSIQGGSSLTLNGPSAFIANASNLNANSALTGLNLNGGILRLLGGAQVTTG